MWERFTERAKHVVSAAREEALGYGSEYVRTEHILLGLCREPNSIAARVLENFGVNRESLARDIARQIERGNTAVSDYEIAFTPRSKQVLENAVEAARALDDSYLGTEHILLGLVREGGGIGAKILKDLDVEAERVEAEVKRLLGAN
jgi:ATP-dependent Clp protease ATP-binding subunit ClpC